VNTVANVERNARAVWFKRHGHRWRLLARETNRDDGVVAAIGEAKRVGGESTAALVPAGGRPTDPKRELLVFWGGRLQPDPPEPPSRRRGRQWADAETARSPTNLQGRRVRVLRPELLAIS
jgi:hypothetical protein